MALGGQYEERVERLGRHRRRVRGRWLLLRRGANGTVELVDDVLEFGVVVGHGIIIARTRRPLANHIRVNLDSVSVSRTTGRRSTHAKLDGLDEEIKGKIYDGRLARRLLVYVLPFWPAMLTALVLLLLNSGLQIIGPLLTKAAVDRYLVPTEAAKEYPWDPYLADDPITGLAQLGMIYLGIILAGLLLQYGQHYLMQYSGQNGMFRLREELISHLQDLDVAFFDRNPVGRLVTRVTNDVATLNELFTSGLVTIVADILLLAFVFLAMLQLSPELTLILMLAGPFVVLITVVFRAKVSRSYRRIRVAVAKINSHIQENISGIRVLQLFNREARSKDEFDKINREHMDAFKDAIYAHGWFYPLIEFVGMCAVAGLLGYGGYKIERGELTLGILLAFFQYGMRFFRPVQDLSEKYNILQAATAAAERIFDLLDTRATIKAPASPKAFPDTPAPIELDHVWFAYKDDDWVLRDVSFTIHPGETLAVVGHTGAGKTTLINLLLRFYDVRKGAIRIGGIDVREMDPAELRTRFGVVLQDPHLFSGTIEGNIRLGTPWIEEEQILVAAEQANLLDYIQSLPEGLSHEVKESGMGISTGQKQLISFARALAHQPRYLILDEATSSVDTETEFRVREALEKLVEGRTSVVIAHRLSTIQKASRILVMHHGEVREIGTHAELVAQRGIYWKLYQLQYKDQEVPAPKV